MEISRYEISLFYAQKRPPPGREKGRPRKRAGMIK